MLFMLGIDRLPREDKVMLLTQLDILTGWNILHEGSSGTLMKSKHTVLQATNRVLRRPKEIEEPTVRVLQKKLEERRLVVDRMTQREIDMRIRDHLVVLAGVDSRKDNTAIARGILYRAARSLKLKPEEYRDLVSLENQIYMDAVSVISKEIKKRVNTMTSEQQIAFEQLVRQELNRLSTAEQDAIRTFTGLDELSSQSLIRFFKTTSSTAMAQLVLGSFGFGAYLFLSTMIKSISLLFGTTFSFATYTTAATMLSFTLSSWFLLLVAVFSAGFMFKGTGNALKDQLARMIVVIGRLYGEVLSE